MGTWASAKSKEIYSLIIEDKLPNLLDVQVETY